MLHLCSHTWHTYRSVQFPGLGCQEIHPSAASRLPAVPNPLCNNLALLPLLALQRTVLVPLMDGRWRSTPQP
uniref:Uncharacterized protein n=1 Tax=Arundo donax TaxID=35708 RepID=A0A0A9ARE8_ARUDO